MDGRTHIEEIQSAIISERHITLVVVANTVATKAHTRAQSETTPTMCPVDIATDTGLIAIEMVGAKHVDTVISDAAIFGIVTLIVAVI